MTTTTPSTPPAAALIGAPRTGPEGGHLRAQPLGAVAAAAVGFAGSLLVVVTAPLWRHAPVELWRLSLPGIPHPGGSFFAGASFVVGVLLMGLGWLLLVTRTDRLGGSERRRVQVVLAVLGIWAIPLLLGPPLLSNDVYSYAAQGELQSRGIDPTAHGPTYLLGGDYLVGADPYWRNYPAPYGPVWIGLSEAVVEVTGHDAAASIWSFRALAVLGVAMAAAGVGLIARSYGRSPATAIALGIANPLVLLHFLGGSHNDALMLGLLALGLAAARRQRWVLGVALVALATAVKLPAAVALPFIGWAWAAHRPGFLALTRPSGEPGGAEHAAVGDAPDGPARPVRFGDRVVTAAVAVGAGGLLVGIMCVVAGIGPGWVFALSGTNKVHSTFSFTTKVGHVSADLADLVGLPLSQDLIVNLCRLAGLAAAGAITVVVLLRSPRLGMVRSVGIVLLVVILLGPVVWPWYLPAALALLAASGLGRYRAPYMVLVLATSLFVFPTSVDTVLFLLGYEHPLGLAVVLVVAAAAFAAYWTVGRRLTAPRSAVAEAAPPLAPAEPASR